MVEIVDPGNKHDSRLVDSHLKDRHWLFSFYFIFVSLWVNKVPQEFVPREFRKDSPKILADWYNFAMKVWMKIIEPKKNQARY